MTAAAFNALEDKGGHTDNRAPMYERRNDGFIPVRRRPSADMRAAARPPMQTVQPDVRGTAIKGGDGVHNFQPWIATANFT